MKKKKSRQQQRRRAKTDDGGSSSNGNNSNSNNNNSNSTSSAISAAAASDNVTVINNRAHQHHRGSAGSVEDSSGGRGGGGGGSGMQQSNSITTTANPITRDDGAGAGAGVNALDKQTDVMKWISQGRIDSKNMAKRFPHTTRDLQEGKVSADSVAHHVLSLAGMMPLAKDSSERILRQCERLTLFVLPPELRRSTSSGGGNHHHHHYAQRWDNSIQWLYTKTLYNNLAERTQHKDADEEWNDEAQVLLALQDACRELAPKVDKRMRNNTKGGTFLKTCIVYNKTQQEFNNDIMPHVVDQSRETFAQLQHSAQGIAAGQLHIERSCWECGKETSKKLSTCAKCVVARYCSSECQAKAWKGGHREKCPNLAAKNEQFLESLQAIDDRVNDENLALSTPHTNDLDYGILQMFIELPSPFRDTTLDGKLKGPSMKYFYENVDRIISGYWWLYPDEDCLSLKEYNDRRCSMPNLCNDKKEMHLMEDIMRYLPFGYVQWSQQNGAPDDLFFRAFFHGNPNSPVKKYFKKRFGGLAMPAKRFIALYLGDNTTSGDFRRKNSTRRQWKGTMQVAFRKQFHK